MHFVVIFLPSCKTPWIFTLRGLGGEWNASHDAIWDVFAFIVKDVRFHILYEQFMFFHHLPFNLFINGLTLCNWLMAFAPLADVLIANPIWTYLVLWVVSFREVATMMLAQTKEVFYHDRHLEDMFIPLAIKVFGCMHQQIDNFFHQCANMAWITKGSTSPLLVILCVFYR
jgi:hypothetical protein